MRLIGEALHGDHRTEDLSLDHLVLLLEAGHHRGLEEEPGELGLAVAGHDLAIHLPVSTEPVSESMSTCGWEPQVVDHEGDLVFAEGGDRLAGVHSFELREFLAVLLDRVRKSEQRVRAFPRRGRAPRLEGAAGGGHGAIDVGCGRERRVGDHLARRRIEDGLGLSLGGSHVLAVDEVLKRDDLRGHGVDRQPTTATLRRAAPRVKGLT